MMSLQKHASEAVFRIDRIFSGGSGGRRAYMGVELEEFDLRFSRNGAPELPFPTIIRVEQSSPASAARLQAGDVIKLVNGADPRGRPFEFFVTKPGDTLALSVTNAGVDRKVTVKLSAPPSRLDAPMACEMVFDSREIGTLLQRDSVAANMLKIPAMSLGRDSTFSLQMRVSSGAGSGGVGTYTFFSGPGTSAVRVAMLRSFFGAQFWSASEAHLLREGAENGGVPVLHVVDNSPAAKAGLLSGDIVTRVRKTPVRTMADLSAAIDSTAQKGAMEIEVIRSRKTIRLTLVPF
jgi:S1-C subfamily serine protease